MAPVKKVRAPQENISLGPSVRDGTNTLFLTFVAILRRSDLLQFRL